MLFCPLLIFSSTSFSNTIRMSDSLDPDQAPNSVGPDPCPNNFQGYQQMTLVGKELNPRKVTDSMIQIKSLSYLKYQCMAINLFQAQCFHVLNSSPILNLINYKIPVVSMYFQSEWKTVWILIRWLCQNPVIWIYSASKEDKPEISMTRIKVTNALLNLPFANINEKSQ